MMLLLATALLAAAPGGVVTRPVGNMYSKPSEDADVVSQAIYGAAVTFVEEAGGWVKVRTADDYTGWMPVTALQRLKDGQPRYAAAGRIAQVDGLFANLYRESSVTRHAPLLTVPFETRLEVVSEPENDERRWIQVRLVDDRPAWVQRGDVIFDLRGRPVEEVIALARRMMGLPYLWGGTSSFGYDCSGFTQMLSRRRGVLIPRDAQPQCQWDGMHPVEKDGLKPGDLLYFGSSLEKIIHTGMYIGAGEFIHATTHERPVVQISRIEDPHWKKLYVAARRLK